MNLLFTMSLSGSIALLFYLVFLLVFRYRLQCRWLLRLLRVSVLFFILPFPLLIFLYPNINSDVRQFLYGDQIHNVIIHNAVPITISEDTSFLFPLWGIILLILWFISVLAFVVYELKKYFRAKKVLLASSSLISDELMSQKFQTDPVLLRTYKKKKIQIYENGAIRSPFTLGFFRPKVFIPSCDLPEAEEFMIYYHEFAHINNKDVLFRFLSLLAMAMHWFNPLSYLLFYEMNRICELACDEYVISTRDRDFHTEYGMLIIKMSINNTATPLVTQSFADNPKKIKGRLQVMKNFKKKKYWTKIVSFLLVILTFGTCSLSSFAYETPYRSDGTDSFLSDNEFIYDEPSYYLPPDYNFDTSDSIFIEANGLTYDLPADDSYSINRASCSHNLVSGTSAQHTKYSNGRCAVTTYRVKRCSKCRFIKSKSFLNKITFKICPH